MSDPNRLIPFMRNSGVPAQVIAVSATATSVPTLGATQLAAAGVTAFTVSNPNPFPVWFKGGTGNPANIDPTGNGNYLAPGATITQSSVRPDWLCATPDTSSLLAPYYAADGVTPLYDMSKAKLVFVYGSGL